MNFLKRLNLPLVVRRAPLPDGALLNFYRGNEVQDSLRIGPNMVHAMVIHPDGTVTDCGVSQNLITDAGIDAVAAAHNGTAFAAKYMAVSNSAVAPSASDTSLASELSTNGFDRDTSTYAHTGGTGTLTMVSSWTATGTVSGIHKMGLFSAASGGTLVYTTAFSVDADVTADDTLEVTDTITLS